MYDGIFTWRVYHTQEERFLYPIYPLLAFIGACTLHQVLNILTPPLRASVTATVPGDGAAERTTQLQPAHYSANARVFRSAVKGLCVAVSAAMFTARVTSNFTNFGGMAVHI